MSSNECPYCHTPYGDDLDENGKRFCDCPDARLAKYERDNSPSYREENAKLRDLVEQAHTLLIGGSTDSHVWNAALDSWLDQYEAVNDVLMNAAMEDIARLKLFHALKLTVTSMDNIALMLQAAAYIKRLEEERTVYNWKIPPPRNEMGG